MSAVLVENNTDLDQLEQLKLAMNELMNTVKTATTPKGKGWNLQKQFSANEQELKASEDAQTKSLEQMPEMIMHLTKLQLISESAPT